MIDPRPNLPKFRLPRKVLTEAEARTKRENCLMSVQNLYEEILYWLVRLNKPLEPIDHYIIFSDKTINSPEEAINRNILQILEKYNRIEKYYDTFLPDKTDLERRQFHDDKSFVFQVFSANLQYLNYYEMHQSAQCTEEEIRLTEMFYNME